ncbi:hypothetical protein GJR96_14015 [Haloferax sp. MBLA0076]|uniref:Uncharacterized protein n=1 Tax=Haloferax litoreum TaxID=2666140 RepID=A0A6A8GJC2_9EURY|nr:MULTISPECIES: hypothetical protein [Haloferax]KAB1194497.1 hypothetical protein Hfx1148_13945 [Haloferax sp. CBA1148]MRX23066.1 hypothetical protein [Haloferax litoreum]
MTETIQGTVLHVVPPDELDDQDLAPGLHELAESRYVVVLRRGGHPSLLDLIWAFIRRDPIEAVTVVTDQRVHEDDELTLTVEETDMAGVYVTASVGRDVD